MGLPLHDALVTNVRTPLVVLLAAVVCVLLIACFNLANLMLTRSAARARELGVRMALGAGRGRIVRQLVTESLLLGLLGGACGLMIAVWTARALATHAPGADSLMPLGTMPIDPIVFAFAFVVAVVTGVAIGLMPALRGSRGDVANELKDATRSTTAGRAHGRFRGVLVAAEVSLSLVLLIAAGLLIRSLARLYRCQSGHPCRPHVDDERLAADDEVPRQAETVGVVRRARRQPADPARCSIGRVQLMSAAHRHVQRSLLLYRRTFLRAGPVSPGRRKNCRSTLFPHRRVSHSSAAAHSRTKTVWDLIPSTRASARS